MRRVVPLEPVVIDGITHYRCEFQFDAAEILKPLSLGLPPEPVRDLVELIRREAEKPQ